MACDADAACNASMAVSCKLQIKLMQLAQVHNLTAQMSPLPSSMHASTIGCADRMSSLCSLPDSSTAVPLPFLKAEAKRSVKQQHAMSAL